MGCNSFEHDAVDAEEESGAKDAAMISAEEAETFKEDIVWTVKVTCGECWADDLQVTEESTRADCMEFERLYSGSIHEGYQYIKIRNCDCLFMHKHALCSSLDCLLHLVVLIKHSIRCVVCLDLVLMSSVSLCGLACNINVARILKPSVMSV